MMRVWRVAVTAALVLGMSLVSAAPALAAPLCAYDSATRTLDITSQGSAITLSTTSILSIAPRYLVVNGAECALLSQVDTVNVDMASISSSNLIFDLTNGPFGPGATDEGNGSSEIEFAVSDLGTDTLTSVVGSNVDDDIAAGTNFSVVRGLVGLINLNVAADGADPDADIAIYGGLPEFLELSGGLGWDVLSGTGVGSGGPHPYTGMMRLEDGEQLAGGSGDDSLITPPLTSNSPDDFSGGAGSDVIQITPYSASDTADYSLDDVANDGVFCPGSGCESANFHSDIETLLGSDMDEQFEPSPAGTVILGAGGDDVIYGGGGADDLRGGPGADSIFGGPGKDVLTGDADGDDIHGGSGFDTVTYEQAGYGVAVSVSINGRPDDGPPAEHDNIASDVEKVMGTAWDDTFVGDGSRNVFVGGDGDDSFSGRGGNDSLLGGKGDDTFNGGPGIDRCSQGSGTGSQVSCER